MSDSLNQIRQGWDRVIEYSRMTNMARVRK